MTGTVGWAVSVDRGKGGWSGLVSTAEEAAAGTTELVARLVRLELEHEAGGELELLLGGFFLTNSL